jgi:hypothetical protein
MKFLIKIGINLKQSGILIENTRLFKFEDYEKVNSSNNADRDIRSVQCANGLL